MMFPLTHLPWAAPGRSSRRVGPGRSVRHGLREKPTKKALRHSVFTTSPSFAPPDQKNGPQDCCCRAQQSPAHRLACQPPAKEHGNNRIGKRMSRYQRWWTMFQKPDVCGKSHDGAEDNEITECQC